MTYITNGYKVRGRVLIPNGTGPRKVYLIRPGYLKTPVTTLWHRNGDVSRLLPHLLKLDYNPTDFARRETFKSGRYRQTIRPTTALYKLDSHADGGYPLLYSTADGCELCAVCATEQVTRRDRDWPRVVSVDPYYEGPTVYCDNCNASIESAYGDPDAENQTP